MATSQLPVDVRQALAAMVREGYPHETCGLLIGSQEEGQTRFVRAVSARNRNTERARDRYILDPDDFLAADGQARAEGLAIVGVWHSHPDHPARPSETDRATAWQGWSYVIISVNPEGITEMRSWRLNGNSFVEETLQT